MKETRRRCASWTMSGRCTASASDSMRSSERAAVSGLRFRCGEIMRLDQSQLHQYQENGYIALKQLLTPQEVQQARDALRELLESLLAGAKSGEFSYTPPKWGLTGN